MAFIIKRIKIFVASVPQMVRFRKICHRKDVLSQVFPGLIMVKVDVDSNVGYFQNIIISLYGQFPKEKSKKCMCSLQMLKHVLYFHPFLH